MATFIANGHVRDTNARVIQRIEAPNARKAATIAQGWARENDLVYDGIETPTEHDARQQEA